MRLRTVAFALGAVGLLFATLTSAARAQETTQERTGAPGDQISCMSNSGNPVFLQSKWFHLVPAAPEEAARAGATKPVFSAAFGAGKYPYDHIDVFLEKTNPRDGGMYGTESTLSIYARAKKGRTESWFALSRDKQDMDDMDFMQQTPLDNATSTDSTGSRSERASFALKDQRVPIISVSWFQGETGANAYSETDKRVLLDFRNAPPSVMGILQCVFHDGGGACTAPDSTMAPTTAVQCNWEATRADFLCTSTETGDYVLPFTHRFYMGSGEDAPYEVKQGDPPDLPTFGKWTTQDRSWTRKTPEIPGLGRVTWLSQYLPAGTNDVAELFAARGRDSYEPRFFAVVVGAQGPAAAFEILSQPLFDEPDPVRSGEMPTAPDTRGSVVPATINAADKIESGNDPSFRVRALETLPNVTLWQVTTKLDNMHEVVWLGASFNRSTGRFVFSAVRIASQFGSYASCGGSRLEPIAASIARKKGSATALIDAEPEHQYDIEGQRSDYGDQGQAVTPCPLKVKLSWNASIGFVRDASETACPDRTRARHLSISDMGVITAAPEGNPAKD
jgi:hypothetical protein